MGNLCYLKKQMLSVYQEAQYKWCGIECRGSWSLSSPVPSFFLFCVVIVFCLCFLMPCRHRLSLYVAELDSAMVTLVHAVSWHWRSPNWWNRYSSIEVWGILMHTWFKSKVKVLAQSCPTPCDPVDYSPPGFCLWNSGLCSLSLLQGSSQSRDQTLISSIAGGFFTIWATREAQFKLNFLLKQCLWPIEHALSISFKLLKHPLTKSKMCFKNKD